MKQNTNIFFNKIYDDTYTHTLKYVIHKCSRLSDIEDILQEIYIDLYRYLVKHGAEKIQNYEAFTMKIAKTKIYKHYTLMDRFKNVIPLISSNEYGEEVNIVDVECDLSKNEVEDSILNKQTIDDIWKTLQEKPQEVRRIFYLYFYDNMKLSEISKDLNISESSVKNKLYRSLKEIRGIYEKGGVLK